MKAGHFAEGFVQRELARLAAALHTTPEGAAYDELYAAQQALKWATEPGGYASPVDAIARRHRVMGIQGGSEDCFPLPDPPRSSGTCFQSD